MQALYRDFGPRGFKIVAVSVDDAGAEQKIRDFVREFGLTFDVLHDPAGAIQKTYATTGVPETFVIGADGVVRKKAYAQDWNSPENRALIARLLDEPRVSAAVRAAAAALAPSRWATAPRSHRCAVRARLVARGARAAARAATRRRTCRARTRWTRGARRAAPTRARPCRAPSMLAAVTRLAAACVSADAAHAPPDRRRRPRPDDAQPRSASPMSDAPAGPLRVLGIETSCDETSAAVVEGAGDDVALRLARDPLAGRAPPLRRRRARDREPRSTSRRSCRSSSGARRRRRRRSATSTRSR